MSKEGEPQIPYRSSKLTQILADSLGHKTLVLAAVNPITSQFTETVSTLNFVDKTRNGKNENYKGSDVPKIDLGNKDI